MSNGYYHRGNYLPSRKRGNFSAKNILGLLLLFLLILIGISAVDNVRSQSLISPVGEISTPILGQLIEENFNFNDDALAKLVLNRLNNQSGDFAVVIEGLNPDSKQKFYYNDHKIMPAASLYKLFLLAAAYREIEGGTLKEDDIISVPETHLIDVLGSKEFGYDDTENNNITYSVSEILNRVATISDNYAAIMLAEKLGWDKVQAKADNIAAEKTTIKSPISTTAFDIALFYRNLYVGKIVSKQSSDKIIDLLSLDQINDRIPDQLPTSPDNPQSLKIAHKTGELSKIRHDAGIVYLEGNPYLIVLMSENLDYEDDGTQLLSDISKDVYDYFVSQ